MLEIDGKKIDFTKPQTWNNSIQIKEGGYVEQRKDGVTTRIEPVQQSTKTEKE